MSGDVQPRKRKDKKRKKDELGIEEPRGVAALGEGDLFMHSHHDHGTGGHWCAKIIFFSLLAILITLIGLIILENRGLSELEANAVESRYSGVLEGWLEEAPDDDHHDEHTLELTHHDGDDHGDEVDNLDESYQNEEDEHSDEADDEENDEDNEDLHDENDEDEQDDDKDSVEQYDDNDEENDNDDEENDNDDEENDNDDKENDDEQLEDSQEGDIDDEDHDEKQESLYEDEDDDDDEDEVVHQTKSNEDDDDDLQEEDDNDEVANDESGEANKDNDDEDDGVNEDQNDDNEDDEEHDEEDDGDEDVVLEKLEKEASEEEPDAEPISTELPALPEDDDDEKNDATSDEKDTALDDIDDDDDDGPEEEEEFLEVDDIEETPVVEHITAPAGKPLVEVEEEVSSEQPPNTLAEEEEYEKRQEELRKEEEQSSHMWLKLSVGGALLVATHAVMRRATHTRDTPEREEIASREETPIIDRRMTIIPEEHTIPAKKVIQEEPRPKIDKKVTESAPLVKTAPIKQQDSEEEEEKATDEEVIEEIIQADDKELYSDEEEVEEDEEIVEEKKEVPKISPPPAESKPAEREPDEESEDPDDVEIIDDEQLEEELEEEEDDEEISDVDDAELLTRLEAKYGKLPEPERPGPKQHKDGGNSINDEWPGEPSDAYWRRQLDSAERELRQGEWLAAAERAGVVELGSSARARWVVARALDSAAEARRDNRLLSRAIAAYLHLLKMNEQLPDKKLLMITSRTLDRIQFRGNYLNAEPVYRLLIRRFPNEPAFRNNLTVSFLMANRADLAEESLKETLQRWPNDRVALAHYGFVLKTKYNKYEEAVEAFRKALEGDTGPASEPRFYYHYGDSLLLLGRYAEAHEVHKRGAALGHFLSPAQRSLYNVDRLKSTPWWNIDETPYARLARALEKSWREILKEGEAAKALYEKEKEGLKERGEWSQLDLFVRGQEVPERCKRAPVTCSIVKSEPAAAGCRRGQVKFSLMAAGTHVRPHVGPTNCRLRMHLGLSNTKDTFIRVDQETRQWEVGKVFMFDDSFEHEVWHNGTGARLVLIVDVWHPSLSPAERRSLPAI